MRASILFSRDPLQERLTQNPKSTQISIEFLLLMAQIPCMHLLLQLLHSPAFLQATVKAVPCPHSTPPPPLPFSGSPLQQPPPASPSASPPASPSGLPSGLPLRPPLRPPPPASPPASPCSYLHGLVHGHGGLLHVVAAAARQLDDGAARHTGQDGALGVVCACV